MTKVVKLDSKKAKKEPIDFDGFISKIRIDKKSEIPEIHYNLKNDKSEKITILKGKARPLDEFLTVMQSLAGVFCEICEIKDKINHTIITTVNFSEKNGVIISGQVELENGIPQPLCMNTPHIILDNENGGYEISKANQEILEELKRQAILYIRGEGKEKQTSLDLKEG